MKRWLVVALVGLVACGGRVSENGAGTDGSGGSTGAGAGESTGTGSGGGGSTGTGTGGSTGSGSGGLAAGTTDGAAMVCENPDGTVVPVVEKSFLVLQSASGGPEPAWTLRVHVASESPNVGSLLGSEWTDAVHFQISADELKAVEPEEGVADAWAVTNVGANPGCILNMNDLWQLRDWVEISFAKTDATDLTVFEAGNASAHECIPTAKDVTASLVAGSFGESETAGTMQWSLSLTGTMTCAAYAGVAWSAQLDYAFTRP